MRLAQICILFCTVFKLGCSSETSNVDESAFINEFLRGWFASELKEGAVLVIYDRISIDDFTRATSHSEFSESLIADAIARDVRLGEAARSLCDRNIDGGSIREMWKLDVGHVGFDEVLMSEVFLENSDKVDLGWDTFYKMFPNASGLITLSRPGFSEDGSIGIIYMGVSGGALAGHGRLYVVERRDGRWEDADWELGRSWQS
ncbi:MAG: hypothetical protein AAF591_08705 [Verrucomicrobiota bacterium]